MRRIVVLLTVVAMMVAMMVVMAAPAFASPEKPICEGGGVNDDYLFCRGGEGGKGGGFGTLLTRDYTQPGIYTVFILGEGGGGGGSGGGGGGRCAGYLLDPESFVCHGGGSS
jgi:hypothetical protein